MKAMTLEEARAFLRELGESCLHGRVPMETTIKLYFAATKLDDELRRAESELERRPPAPAEWGQNNFDG